MDKNDTVIVTKQWRQVLIDLQGRFNFTDTEKNALEFSILLYDKELAQLETDVKYKGR